ncbi:MAG: hypothetical protein ACTSPG_02560 [Candidatus Hodarchaeales archaeon]
MKEDKDSTTKKIGRFLGKKAVEAGRIFDKELKKAGKIARDELKEFDIANIVVEPIKRPKNESRLEFTRKRRPTKTYAQANRTIQYFTRNPDREELNPGIDGLVSFSILIAPFAALIGLMMLFLEFPKGIAILLLILYTLIVAIPGAYLGLDSIVAGMRSVVIGGTTTIMTILQGLGEFMFLIFQGFVELAILFLNGLFGFAKGAFETIADYIAFILVYIIFTLGIWILLANLNITSDDIIINGFIILLPALLPASIAHRYWFLWRMDRRKQ